MMGGMNGMGMGGAPGGGGGFGSGGDMPSPPMGGQGGGMMGRDTIERIVGSLDSGTLLKALAAVGVRIDGAQGPAPMQDAQQSIIDQMAPWGQTMVKVPLTRRPPVVNLGQTTDMPQPPMQLNPGALMGAGPGPDISPWAAASGA